MDELQLFTDQNCLVSPAYSPYRPGMYNGTYVHQVGATATGNCYDGVHFPWPVPPGGGAYNSLMISPGDDYGNGGGRPGRRKRNLESAGDNLVKSEDTT